MVFPLRFKFIKTMIIKELLNYFCSPIAYVFLVIFILLNTFFTFYFSNILAMGQANLSSFFLWHPWIYLFLVPAIGMGLWSEEYRVKTFELLLSLPISIGELVIGKFLGAWIFISVALLCTIPIPLTIIWLGNPDIGLIILGYFISYMLAGTFLSITCIASAISRNQIISYIIGLSACLLLIVIGNQICIEYWQSILPYWLTSFIEVGGIQYHLQQVDKGVLKIENIIYFSSLILFSLYITCLVIENKKNS